MNGKADIKFSPAFFLNGWSLLQKTPSVQNTIKTTQRFAWQISSNKKIFKVDSCFSVDEYWDKGDFIKPHGLGEADSSWRERAFAIHLYYSL